MNKARDSRLELAAQAVAVLGLLCSSCQVVAGYEPFEPRENAPAAHPCDRLPVTKTDATGLLALTKETSGGCFWIDRTEVTVAAYRRFLSEISTPVTWNLNDSTACAWKVNPFDPESSPDDACVQTTSSEDAPFADDKPIRCVDWCDALAYCRWADKSLCGAEPLVGATLSDDELPWAAACSEAGIEFPYGTQLEHRTCNIGLERHECANLLELTVCGPAPVDVEALEHCASPNGAVQMVGNVAEWTAECGKSGEPQNQSCQVEGGSFDDDENDVNCLTRTMRKQRSERDRRVGFRCCDELSDAEVASLPP